MSTLPRVLAPVETLGSTAGVAIAVLFVEVWPDGVRVVLAGLPGGETDRLDTDYRSGLQDWARRRRAGEEVEPPGEPGVLSLLDAAGVELTDDLGTRYGCGAITAGEVGSWRAVAALRPAPPPPARRLAVSLLAGGRPIGRVEIDLAERDHDGFADPTQGPLARVLSPRVVLGDVDGVPVVLAGVELWPGRTTVTLLAPKNPGGASADPAQVLHLADDRGTVYRWSGGLREDFAEGWRRELTSSRPVPMGVRELTFRLLDASAGHAPYRLALPPA